MHFTCSIAYCVSFLTRLSCNCIFLPQLRLHLLHSKRDYDVGGLLYYYAFIAFRERINYLVNDDPLVFLLNL